MKFDEGDEIIVSALDHEANIASWLDLAEKQKLVVKWWKPAPGSNPKLTPENLRGLLSDRTRLVTLTHASNILGTIHDVKAISTAVHTVNPTALVCVDAVAYAPHRQIDVKDLGVDCYCFSWYKVYGPHISMLYVSNKAQEQMTSLGHYFNPHKTLDHKIGLAGSSYELVYAIPAVADYLTPAGGKSKWDGIVEQESLLAKTLLDYLNSRDDVAIWGEPSSDPNLRVPTISFTVKGWGSQELVETVENETNFGFRFGSFYSVRLLEEVLGLDKEHGVVRVSMVHYNTGTASVSPARGVSTNCGIVDEVKGLVSALDKTLSRER